MSAKPKVLILAKKPEDAENFAVSLYPHPLEVIVARDLREAVNNLKENSYAILVVESHLAEGRMGTGFLAEARKRLPGMLRVLIETAPLNISTHSLINEIAPTAIHSGYPEPEDIWKLAQDWLKARPQSNTANLKGDMDETTGTNDEEMSETEKLAMATEISCSLTALIEDPNLVLPVLPEIAMKVRDVMENDRNSFEPIAELVETEQGMSARILQVANSPIYAGLERIKNLQQAVGRLGLRETRNILQAVIAQNLFRTRDRSVQHMMRTLWLHSLSTAYGNEMIAQKLDISESSDYFMMGLLHDIGKLLIFHLVNVGREQGMWGHTDKPIPEDVLRKVLWMRHNDLGARLLEIWRYPSHFQDVIRLHDDETNVDRRAEPVIVTYFSNLLTRKLGFSLVPYEGDPLSRETLAEALNMSPDMREGFEQGLRVITEKIKVSCFAE